MHKKVIERMRLGEGERERDNERPRDNEIECEQNVNNQYFSHPRIRTFFLMENLFLSGKSLVSGIITSDTMKCTT